ncbi:MAG: adenine-specific methyltransferase EcoRI family protein [Bacteroidaceae bacterium]|nr:adenine-specific methyltransferase EcoRI family protein [Bacteroidaceae bacterium]MBR1651921.1 adenine-specific methyltransferase EcoRI family protein [Alloprevotella sp.]
MANKNLNAAKTAKKDEFYTQMGDIERELQHYWPHFRDKVVLCNCDDPYESNFFKYFALNFNQLGLKKLISTCFDGSPVQGMELQLPFGEEEENEEQAMAAESVPLYGLQRKSAYKVEITEVKDLNGDGAVDLADVQYLLKNDKNVISMLKQHGDFRSAECIELLKQADIVVTNPPFSLFREYIGQLMQYEKKFLIIGNMNAIHYKEVFPLIKENKVWTGFKPFGGGMNMIQSPTDFDPQKTTSYTINEQGQIIKNIMGVIWFTNLDISKRHETLDLVCKYSPEDYPRYDNYEAIDVGKVQDIPFDFPGVMGVPDTILGQYNPDQFEIVGLGCGDLGKQVGVGKNYRGRTDLAYTQDGKHKCPYSRILIRNKHPKKL